MTTIETTIRQTLPSRDNRGLRAAVREAIAGPLCRSEARRQLAALASTVALTALGQSALDAIADAHPEYHPGCDCDDCVAGSLQALGALG